MSRKRFLIDVHMQIDLELDDLVIDRCVNNEDEDGVAQERSATGTGWRDHFYDLDTAESVAQHLAYNLAIKDHTFRWHRLRSASGAMSAWWVICVSKDRPDGPGTIVGPFHDRELAESDARNFCDKNHLVVHGPGPDVAAYDSGEFDLPRAIVGYSDEQRDSLIFYASNPGAVPPQLVDYLEPWFKTYRKLGLAVTS